MTSEWRDVIRSVDRFTERLLLGDVEPPEHITSYLLMLIESHDPQLGDAVVRALDAHWTVLQRRARIAEAYERVNGPT